MFKKFFRKFRKSEIKINSNLDFFTGGDGSSFENAVIIITDNPINGITDEYKYISIFYGKIDSDWTRELQSLNSHNDKTYDVIKIKLRNGDVKEIYFDISNFFGKY